MMPGDISGRSGAMRYPAPRHSGHGAQPGLAGGPRWCCDSSFAPPLGGASSSSCFWDPVGRDAGTELGRDALAPPRLSSRGRDTASFASRVGVRMARTSLRKSRGSQWTLEVRPSWAPALTLYGRPVGPGVPHTLPQKLRVHGTSYDVEARVSRGPENHGGDEEGFRLQGSL